MAQTKWHKVSEIPRGIYARLQCGCVITRKSALPVKRWTGFFTKIKGRWHKQMQDAVFVNVVTPCKKSIVGKQNTKRKNLKRSEKDTKADGDMAKNHCETCGVEVESPMVRCAEHLQGCAEGWGAGPDCQCAYCVRLRDPLLSALNERFGSGEAHATD